MSIKIMSEIWDHGPESPTEKLVLLALADWANDDGECWPAIAAIARKSSLSERAVRSIIRRLEAAGILEIAPGGGRSNCNLYRIKTRQELPPGRSCPPEVDARNPADDCTKPGRSCPRTVRNHQDPLLPLCIPPPAERAVKKRRATSLPENWVPSERNVADAQNAHFTAEEINHEADAFRDYHLAKGSTFRDWNAAWRTWLRNARKFASYRERRDPHLTQLAGFAAVANQGRQAG